NITPQDYKLGKVSEVSGRSVKETLEYLLNLVNNNKVQGIIYGPLNKEALHKGGNEFQSELEFFADQLNYKTGYGEVNYVEGLWITRVTSHIPLKEVYKHITKDNLLNQIKFTDEVLKKSGIDNPKIALPGLNPHAGDGGLMGDEEIKQI